MLLGNVEESAVDGHLVVSNNVVKSIVYLNGKYLALQDASISVLDRGFIFGDGVYDVIPVYNKRPFRLYDHLDRLGKNLVAVQIENPYSMEEWCDIISRVIEENNSENQSIYIQVTRGVSPREHRYPRGVMPTVFIMSSVFEQESPDISINGVLAITLEDTRWKNCNIKSISLLPSVLLREQAVISGAKEAILIRDGHVTEGATSNVFIVKDDYLITPPKSGLLLSGVTRDVVLEIARLHKIRCEEAIISESDLFSAQEIWLTGSMKEILPVTKLDDRIIGTGMPGLHWRNMAKLYRDFIRDELYS